MENTTANDVIKSFESSFGEKKVLPESLEFEWLNKAIGRYSMEVNSLTFDEDMLEFDKKLDRYVIDTLAEFMKQLYQERVVSMINKRASIVTKEISVDGNNGGKTAVKNELDYIDEKTKKMAANQTPSAYA